MTTKEQEIVATATVDVIAKALAPLRDRIAALEEENRTLRDRVLLLEAGEAAHVRS
jgi:hypothetical protein